MSSMRNAVQRRNHKERSQLHSRQKLGILEKHKDYTLRAKDFNEKKRRLKVLRQKASERNPDEFHFAMMRSRTDSVGRKIADKGNTVLSDEAVKLMKTQDTGYLRTMSAKTRKDIEKLEQSMAVDVGEDFEGDITITLPGRKQTVSKTVFVDDEDEQAATIEQRLGDLNSDGTSDGDGNRDTDAANSRLKRLKKRSIAWREARLEALRKREQDLTAASAALDLERARMSNSIGGVNKNGVKFKQRERKR